MNHHRRHRCLLALFNVLPSICLGKHDYRSGYDAPSPPSGHFQGRAGLYGLPDPRGPNSTPPPFPDGASAFLAPLYPPLGPAPPPPPTADHDGEQPVPYAASDGPVPVRLRVSDMSCSDATSERHFRSVVSTARPVGAPPPVVDAGDAGNDCVLGAGDTFRIDVRGGARMAECGVRYCPEADRRSHLCVSLRLPTVRGLRLAEDNLIRLQCRPQDRIASQTKHLTVAPRTTQGRSPSMAATASGGSQRDFESQISLFRGGPGAEGEGEGSAREVIPGSVVQLGEDLLLRAAVREGDGWKYSRLGAVTVYRTTVPSRDSVVLVDSSGCRVPAVASLCPEQPRQIEPLVTTFPFRAFMFQGAESGEEMLLSVRILGCVQPEDCVQARFCPGDQRRSHARARREARRAHDDRNSTNRWQSYLEFRVVLSTSSGRTDRGDFLSAYFPFVFGGFVLFLLVSLGVIGTARKQNVVDNVL